jgi:hypothetical protein
VIAFQPFKKRHGAKNDWCQKKRLFMKLGIYKHYKGKIVEVIGVGKHTETLDNFVIYKEGKNFWLRPEEMFKEKVIVDGKLIPRFKYLKEKGCEKK